MESWKPIYDEKGNVMINGNNIVLENINTMEIGYLENNDNNRKMLSIDKDNSVESNVDSGFDSADLLNSGFDSGDIPKGNKWTHKLTKLLINKRLSCERQFNRPQCKKIKLWCDIAREINIETNGSLKAEDCDNKYRNLLKTYKVNKKKQKSSGESAITWEYFSDFDEVLGYKASIEPPQNTLFDTMECANVNGDEESNIHEDTQDNESSIVELNSSFKVSNEITGSNTVRETYISRKKKTLPFNEYLYLKNQREEEKQRTKALFHQHKWEEEKELRMKETNAILKLAESLARRD